MYKGDSMVCYCKKCGRITYAYSKKEEKMCDYCKNCLYPIPLEYTYNGEGNNISTKLKEQFIEEVIKTSPEFDEQMYLGMKQYVDNRDYGRSLRAKVNGNVPKCPTCSSTKITKISTTSKVAGAAMFGLFSKTARSQFKCNSCGYKW